MADSLTTILPPPAPNLPPGRCPEPLRDAAQQIESLFLAEMLKSSGLDAVPGAFGGGVGEDHFSSFLIDAQAREMAKAGGIGLAESLCRSLAGHADGD